MEISRILRVLITILLAVTFIVVTLAAYQRDHEIERMVELSDSTSSIATRLSVQDLAWVDEDGEKHPYVLDNGSLTNLEFTRILGGDNFAFRVQIFYMASSVEDNLGPYGLEPPSDRMTGSLTMPTSLYWKGSITPAKLSVTVWYA
ncbi:hypothetical protein AKJ46_00710 [candidate division MSBL1 archaeon SCGC-AAA833K04]|uniref:Uncharacterized protein n=1 Tax=candidate division MSBL1 archaeon SCGC-AAA833K04 TaxID=1698258 RepID=A0A133VS38_9EURY|nr:hypothetical protein AKJ46_00710 [candidate division MSBL1 archaeon SCGC-AAA833K04]